MDGGSQGGRDWGATRLCPATVREVSQYPPSTAEYPPEIVHPSLRKTIGPCATIVCSTHA